MSRVQIALPEKFMFSTDIPVMVSHVNRGNHLGNDTLISFLNEARLRFVLARGFSENDNDTGLMMVNADLAMIYQSEGRYGELLEVALAATDFHRCGYDIVYRVREKTSGRPVAQAKTAHILINAQSGEALSEPEGYFDPLR